MNNPIENTVTIISNKDTFEKIVSLLIDEENGETTYEKFWPVPEGKDKNDIYNCTKGIYAGVDREKQTIDFTTNHMPAVLIVERIAQMFPEAKIEYAYDLYDDEVHEVFDVYEKGILISREDEIIDFEEEDFEDEEDDEDEEE